ncbi:MAG: Short C-terminal protein [Conexibacter sp.]|nr:Short C-terminal protein [Conexibacter sp.]
MFKNRRTRKHGLPAEATVLSIEDKTGMTSDTSRTFLHVLEVRPEGREPFRAEVREVFGIVSLRPAEYDVLRVKYDPGSLNVVFDFEGDPRYDLEASRARTLEMRRQTAELLKARKEAEAGGIAPLMAVALGGPGGQPVMFAGAIDPVARVEALAKLKTAGMITDAQFEALKAELLAGG